jgi:hypothetical protein
MAVLYGITPDSKIVKKTAQTDWEAGLLRDGKIVKCFRTIVEAKNKAKPNDVVVVFTKAVLVKGRNHAVVIYNAPTISYPSCYQCHTMAGMLGERWNGRETEIVPACWKHAKKEVKP